MYGVTLFFLIPAVMAMLSSINSEMKMLWRTTFAITGALGIVEIARYFTTEGIRTRAAILLGMVIVIGVHLAFLALTESSDTAGA